MALFNLPNTFGMGQALSQNVGLSNLLNQQQAQASSMISAQSLNQAFDALASQQYSSGRVTVMGGGGGGAGVGGAGGVGQIFYGEYLMGTPGMQGVAPSHFGQVRAMRKEFKKYTKEEFRHISKNPLVKDIIMGMTKLDKEQITERIKEHIEAI